MRNIQIGFPSIILSFGVLIFREHGAVPFVHFDPVQGWDFYVVLLILNHACGGILVAIVVKYADNIMKGFATGVAMVISGAYAAAFWGFKPDVYFVLGCVLVICGTVTYHSNIDHKRARDIARLLPGGHRIPDTPLITVNPEDIHFSNVIPASLVSK